MSLKEESSNLTEASPSNAEHIQGHTAAFNSALNDVLRVQG